MQSSRLQLLLLGVCKLETFTLRSTKFVALGPLSGRTRYVRYSVPEFKLIIGKFEIFWVQLFLCNPTLQKEPLTKLYNVYGYSHR